MEYHARRAIESDKADAPYLVEHDSGKLEAQCLTWREAVMIRDRLQAEAEHDALEMA